ncbi:MAG: hypothetical protein ABIF77_01785 [bacterium]
MRKLKRHPVLPVLACVLVCTGIGIAVDLGATPTDMDKLPVSSRFGCLNCHLLSEPIIGSSELNPFGVDYQTNGRIWDEALAALNSDDDGCTNGVELGDSDGNGERDENVIEETGNPGEVDDCGGGSLIDPVTWGALKALFSDSDK